jgi:hypothetical protein
MRFLLKLIPGRSKARHLLKHFINEPVTINEVLFNYVSLAEENRQVWRDRGARRIYDIGHYCEFGVMNGSTMIAAWKTLCAFYGGPGKVPAYWRLHGFDSFEGLPASADAADAHPYAGAGSYKSRGIDYVASRLEAAGVPRDRFTLTKGYFEHTLTKEVFDRIGLEVTTFLHIDCDLYTSTLEVLRRMEPLMKNGTLLFVDDIDYFQYNPHKGNLTAIATFNGWDPARGLAPAPRFDKGNGHAYMLWRDQPVETENVVWHA